MTAVETAKLDVQVQPPGPPVEQSELGSDQGKHDNNVKDVEKIEKNGYTRTEQDRKIKLPCNMCDFVAEKEGSVKRHMTSKHVFQLVLMIHWLKAQHVPLIYSRQVNLVMFYSKLQFKKKMK